MLAAWLILVLLSIATGVVIHLSLRCFSNQAELRAVKRRKRAWLYELRLYADEPALIARAQLSLLKDNLRHMAILLKPLAVLAVPLGLIFFLLAAIHGKRPLPPGEPATLTVRLASPFPSEAPRVEAPAGITVETPPVRIPAASEVSWRIRPAGEISGIVRIHCAGETVEQTVRAGSGPLFQWPWTARGNRIRSVEIGYPEAGWAWLLWFMGTSLATVLVLNRRYGVSL